MTRTIFDQLGGSRFVAMTGSSNFTRSETSLSMKLSRNRAGATHLVIELDGDDTYTLQFISCRMSKGTLIRTVKANHSGIYGDQLQSIFAEATGLYTTLGIP